jgi:hypothetical protein
LIWRGQAPATGLGEKGRECWGWLDPLVDRPTAQYRSVERPTTAHRDTGPSRHSGSASALDPVRTQVRGLEADASEVAIRLRGFSGLSSAVSTTSGPLLPRGGVLEPRPSTAIAPLPSVEGYRPDPRTSPSFSTRSCCVLLDPPDLNLKPLM